MHATCFSRWIVIVTLIATIDLLGQDDSAKKGGTNAPPKCLTTVYYSDVDTPKLKPIDEQTGQKGGQVLGSLPKAENGSVQVCADDGTSIGSANIANTDSFTVTTSHTLKAGQKIQAQFTDSNGHASIPSEAELVGDCSKLASRDGVAPTLSIVSAAGNTMTYSGAVKGAKDGSVRICINNIPKATASVDSSGKFDGGTATLQVNAGDEVTAQSVNASATNTYGPLSDKIKMVAQPAAPDHQNQAVAVLIGGVEYSGYSAQSQTTNGFLSLFYQGPFYHGVTGWGKIRLTSTPQQATNGVVSVISNPTGLTTYDYSNVGQAIDFLGGPVWRFSQYWSLIAAFGAISPLSSQNTPLTFVAPNTGTVECTQLVQRFSPAAGYNPGLSLNTAPNAKTCLAGGYTDIAFANQDRSSFLLKYGGGFRSIYPWKFGQCAKASDSKCSTAYAALDATIGQDAAVTGGALHKLVFKLDGTLPIPTGNSSWLYLFGSSYIRLQRNQNLPPLILATPASPVTLPSPTVFVLPLRQPNRDYYRIGVGLNVNQLWCKAFGTGCATSSTNDASAGTKPAAARDSNSKTKK